MALDEYTVDVPLGSLRDEIWNWLIWAIERYGYARRDGICQGVRSARWMKGIQRALKMYELSCLDALEGQAGRLYKRIAVLERELTEEEAGKE